MSDLDVLAGIITPPAPAGGGVPASFDTGTVTKVIDATHVKVNLGDKEVTVYVPATKSGTAPAGATVRVSAQENTYVLDAAIEGAGAGTVPVGSIVMWMTATIPAGWLKLDGGQYSATAYPALFAVLGTTFLPNMADRVPVGMSGTKAVTTTGGASSVTLTEAQLPAHDHSMAHTHTANHSHRLYVWVHNGANPGAVGDHYGMPYANNGNRIDAATSFQVQDNYVDTASVTTSASSFANTGNAGSGASIPIQNPYVSLHFIIKAA